MLPGSYLTRTLAVHPYRGALLRILNCAIQAVAPEHVVKACVQRQGDVLRVGDREYHLSHHTRLRILGVGKAACAMSLPLVDLLADRSPQGLLIPKHPPTEPVPGLVCQVGGHPIPGENSLRAGEQVLQLVQGLTEDDLLICLISGGGSALMSASYPGVSLADLQGLTAVLLSCGAPIAEINTLRRHLDQLKGGGLARLAAPARVVSLILSDVVGNPLEAIASGPTAPDPTTRLDALSILDRYALRPIVPLQVLKTLETAPETLKPGDALFERVQNLIVGSNQIAAQAALQQADVQGFNSLFLGDTWQGEAREVSIELCHLLKTIRLTPPFCLVAGGETTVTLHGHGRGGRNQELALAAVPALAGIPNVLLVVLATDGEDGPTDAAGAVVSGETYQRGLDLGLSPDDTLSNNDAYTYFDRLGDLLKPGPSGTNVNDLFLLFRFA
jgi:hydroxypyruvate reductase